MKIKAIEPHGFCAGVTAALRKAVALLSAADSKVYCLHELVHNEIVVRDLKSRGMVFVEDINDIPEGATVLFSAHGVSPAVRDAAAKRNLKVVDATCPFVEKVHKAAREFSARGLPVIVIGNPDHVEVKGIVGEFEKKEPNLGDRVGVVSQTTMNSDEVAKTIDELKHKYEVETMAEVCNATKVRQDAVKAFEGDAILVLGSANSSNTRRLCEVARCRAFRAGSMEELKALDFSGIKTLGLTSGASTPETFFAEARAYLEGLA